MTRDQIYAYGRNVVSGVAGALAAIGVMKSVDVDTLLKALDQINQAVGLIITAVGVITPIVAAIFAKRSAAPEAQVARALDADPRLIIDKAVEKTPTAAINAVADLPQVTAVVTDAKTAVQAPSPSVINVEQARKL